MWHVKQENKSIRFSPSLILLLSLVFLSIAIIGLRRSRWQLDVLDAAEPVLAVVAIVFASIQFRDAHNHTRKMEEIASSMSTRFVGDFPKDMEDIVDVTGLADRTVWVMASFADYGHYSKPGSFERFLEKIHAALSRNVAVQFLVYDEERANESLEKRFPKAKFADERTCPRFKHFFTTHYEGITEPQTHEDFLGVLRRKRKEVMSDLLDRGAQIRLLTNQERLFFWMEDKEDAVFSFENGATQSDPLCFRTRDARLIDTFSDIFEQNWSQGKDYLKTLRMPPNTGQYTVSHENFGIPSPVRLIPPHSFPPSATGG